MRRGRPENVYALYKGDEFIDVGTKRELSEKMNWKKSTVSFLHTPANAKRNKGNRYVLINAGEVED